MERLESSINVHMDICLPEDQVGIGVSSTLGDQQAFLEDKEKTYCPQNADQQKLLATPPKVARVVALISNLDPEYDLTRNEHRRLQQGLDTLKAMSPRRSSKRLELSRRLSFTLKHRLDPSLASSSDKDPRKHRSLASKLSRSRWAGRTIEQVMKIHSNTPGVQNQERLSPRYLHLDHITKYTERGGGLHLCSPSSPDWPNLFSRTTITESGVFAALIRSSSGNMKFSSFWPIETTEDDLIVMQENATVVEKTGNTELVKVNLKSGIEVAAIRYVRPGYIGSFYPLFCSILVFSTDRDDIVINFSINQAAPCDVQFTISPSLLISEIVKTPIETVFENREKDLIYVDCTMILHQHGLMPIFEKGFIFAFKGSELGYVFFEKEQTAALPKQNVSVFVSLQQLQASSASDTPIVRAPISRRLLSDSDPQALIRRTHVMDEEEDSDFDQEEASLPPLEDMDELDIFGQRSLAQAFEEVTGNEDDDDEISFE